MITYLIIILWLFSPHLLSTIISAAGASSPPVRRAFVLGLARIRESLLPRPGLPITSPGSVSLTTVSGVSWVLPCYFQHFHGSGDLADSRSGTETSRAIAGPTGPRVARAHLPVLQWNRLLPGPSLDGNPVLWREWHRSKSSTFMRLAWALYWGFGVVWIVFALLGMTSDVINVELIATMNVFQVGVGLLLLSVSAVTSLAEERMRGSLDALLTTPLSTRSILAGKWGGAYRIVPRLLFVPAVTSLLIACDSGHWIKMPFLPGTSAGILRIDRQHGPGLATWQSRPGRAATSCVARTLVLCIGWPALVFALTKGIVRRTITWFCRSSSAHPSWAPCSGLWAFPIQSHAGADMDIWIGLGLWIATYGALATFLFETTAGTFDGCLGRVPETDLPPEWNERKRATMADFGDRRGQFRKASFVESSRRPAPTVCRSSPALGNITSISRRSMPR